MVRLVNFKLNSGPCSTTLLVPIESVSLLLIWYPFTINLFGTDDKWFRKQHLEVPGFDLIPFRFLRLVGRTWIAWGLFNKDFLFLLCHSFWFYRRYAGEFWPLLLCIFFSFRLWQNASKHFPKVNDAVSLKVIIIILFSVDLNHFLSLRKLNEETAKLNLFVNLCSSWFFLLLAEFLPSIIYEREFFSLLCKCYATVNCIQL